MLTMLTRALVGPLASFGIFALVAGNANAEPLALPTGDVILTVRGDLEATNSEDGAQLDRAMIESMGVETVHTGTIWTEGSSAFEGISLARLMVRLGADGSILRLTALNDYAVEIPMSEAVDGGPLLAYRMDGTELSPRDKGPLWMIYPFDSNPDYKNDVSYSRSIWQLTMIEVLP